MVPSGSGCRQRDAVWDSRFSNGTFKPFSTPNFDGTKISVQGLLLDRNGNLWVATLNNGLYRIHGNIADHFGLADGLSGNVVAQIEVTAFLSDINTQIWAKVSG